MRNRSSSHSFAAFFVLLSTVMQSATEGPWCDRSFNFARVLISGSIVLMSLIHSLCSADGDDGDDEGVLMASLEVRKFLQSKGSISRFKAILEITRSTKSVKAISE